MAPENHPEKELGVLSSAPAVTRRDFLKRLGLMGGGLVVYLTVGDPAVLARTTREGFITGDVPIDFNAFLRIGSDNRVTCLVGKIEMGQGIITSFAQMLAEELDVPFDSVEVVMGDTDLCPWDAGTWGSLSTRLYGRFVKEAAGEAKGVLKELASEYLSCPSERLITKDGVLFDKDRPMNRVTYGRLTAGKIIEKHLKDLPPLKPASEYTISGSPYLRRDAFEKVTGQARYAGDVRVPGMVYARILRPPAHGAKLESVDTSAAEKMKGVQVIRDGDLIAVLHQHPDEAEKALRKIKARFESPETGINDKNIFEHLAESIPEADTAFEEGDLEAGEKLSETVVEETYLNSYVAHAPMETHTALATIEGNKATVWASTQSPFVVREQVARALSLPGENVRIVTPFVGGGFGGKVASAQAVEAARLAKAAGRPVMVVWSRAEEFFYDTFRPAAVVKIRSGMDGSGRITFWDYKVCFAGAGSSEVFFDIPHHRVAAYGGWLVGADVHPFAVGPWRAPAANTNVYARELHINLMASKAGRDPLEYRLSHLKDERMTGVLEAAAARFGWTPAQIPSGRGHGICCGIYGETYVASMAEVQVDRDSGKIQVKRAVCAQDMGHVVNPEGAKLQMEGCVTMGLGYALTEEIRFINGRILDTNFDTYQIPRFSWLPKIETILVENKDLPPKGGGEPSIACMGGVLATAVFDATGAKMLQLPMTPDRVKEAAKRV